MNSTKDYVQQELKTFDSDKVFCSREVSVINGFHTAVHAKGFSITGDNVEQFDFCDPVGEKCYINGVITTVDNLPEECITTDARSAYSGYFTLEGVPLIGDTDPSCTPIFDPGHVTIPTIGRTHIPVFGDMSTCADAVGRDGMPAERQPAYFNTDPPTDIDVCIIHEDGAISIRASNVVLEIGDTHVTIDGQQYTYSYWFGACGGTCPGTRNLVDGRCQRPDSVPLSTQASFQHIYGPGDLFTDGQSAGKGLDEYAFAGRVTPDSSLLYTFSNSYTRSIIGEEDNEYAISVMEPVSPYAAAVFSTADVFTMDRLRRYTLKHLAVLEHDIPLRMTVKVETLKKKVTFTTLLNDCTAETKITFDRDGEVFEKTYPFSHSISIAMNFSAEYTLDAVVRVNCSTASATWTYNYDRYAMCDGSPAKSLHSYFVWAWSCDRHGFRGVIYSLLLLTETVFLLGYTIHGTALLKQQKLIWKVGLNLAIYLALGHIFRWIWAVVSFVPRILLRKWILYVQTNIGSPLLPKFKKDGRKKKRKWKGGFKNWMMWMVVFALTFGHTGALCPTPSAHFQSIASSSLEGSITSLSALSIPLVNGVYRVTTSKQDGSDLGKTFFITVDHARNSLDTKFLYSSPCEPRMFTLTTDSQCSIHFPDYAGSNSPLCTIQSKKFTSNGLVSNGGLISGALRYNDKDYRNSELDCFAEKLYKGPLPTHVPVVFASSARRVTAGSDRCRKGGKNHDRTFYFGFEFEDTNVQDMCTYFTVSPSKYSANITIIEQHEDMTCSLVGTNTVVDGISSFNMAVDKFEMDLSVTLQSKPLNLGASSTAIFVSKRSQYAGAYGLVNDGLFFAKNDIVNADGVHNARKLGALQYDRLTTHNANLSIGAGVDQEFTCGEGACGYEPPVSLTQFLDSLHRQDGLIPEAHYSMHLAEDNTPFLNIGTPPTPASGIMLLSISLNTTFSVANNEVCPVLPTSIDDYSLSYGEIANSWVEFTLDSVSPDCGVSPTPTSISGDLSTVNSAYCTPRVKCRIPVSLKNATGTMTITTQGSSGLISAQYKFEGDKNALNLASSESNAAGGVTTDKKQCALGCTKWHFHLKLGSRIGAIVGALVAIVLAVIGFKVLDSRRLDGMGKKSS